MSDDDPLSPEYQQRHQNPWDPFWAERTAGLWYRPNEQAYFKKSDNMLARPFIDPKWDPRPDIPVEDQRGLTLPELDLQAKYLRGQGAYGSKDFQPPPIGTWRRSNLDPAYDVDTPLGMELGRGHIDEAAKQVAQEVALRHAGEMLAMHELARPPPPPAKKPVKKKEVK